MAVDKQQPAWQQTVRAFRRVADELSNPIEVLGEILAAETLPDLEPDLPILTVAPFGKLADGTLHSSAEKAVMVKHPAPRQTDLTANNPSQAKTPPSPELPSSPRQPKSTLLPTSPDRKPETPAPIFSLRQRKAPNANSPVAIAAHPSHFPHQPSNPVNHPDPANPGDRTRETADQKPFNPSTAPASDLPSESQSEPSVPESLQLLNSLTDSLLRSQTTHTPASTPIPGEPSIQASVPWEPVHSKPHPFSPFTVMDGVASPPSGAIAAPPASPSPLSPLPSLSPQHLLSQEPESTGTSPPHPTAWTELVKQPDQVNSPLSLPIEDNRELSQRPVIESIPTPPARITASQVADLLNEALIEQAQRHGVDLS